MSRYFAVFQLLLMLAVIAVAIPLSFGFLGSWHPAFDSFAHFRVHLAVALGLMAVALFFSALRAQAALALVFSLSALSTTTSGSILPGLGPVHAAFAPKDEKLAVFRLLQMNVLFRNRQPGEVLSMVGRVGPDVITLEEVSARWEERLQPLLASYPHHVFCPYPNGIFGVAILSRRPFAGGTQPICYDAGAFAVARVDFGGREADIAAIHVGWPWPFGQHEQIDRLTPPLSELGETALLAGDLNAAPWSYAVARVAAISGTTHMPLEGATWQLEGVPEFLRFAGLQIDHVFAKGNVLVHSVGTLEAAGSDHLPVLVEFSIGDGGEPADQAATATASLARAAPHG